MAVVSLSAQELEASLHKSTAVKKVFCTYMREDGHKIPGYFVTVAMSNETCTTAPPEKVAFQTCGNAKIPDLPKAKLSNMLGGCDGDGGILAPYSYGILGKLIKTSEDAAKLELPSTVGGSKVIMVEPNGIGWAGFADFVKTNGIGQTKDVVVFRPADQWTGTTPDKAWLKNFGDTTKLVASGKQIDWIAAPTVKMDEHSPLKPGGWRPTDYGNGGGQHLTGAER